MNSNEKQEPNPNHSSSKDVSLTKELTSTERKIIDKLGDGLAHNSNELLNCLYDVLGAELITLQMHISNINKKIKPAFEIISINTRGKPRTKNLLYRLIRSLKNKE